MELAALQRRAGDSAGAFKTLSAAGARARAAIPLMPVRWRRRGGLATRGRGPAGCCKASYEQRRRWTCWRHRRARTTRTRRAGAGTCSTWARTLAGRRRQWLAGEKLEHEQFHPRVQRALDHAVKPLTLPLRRLRLRGQAALLAMPGLPGLGQLSRPAGGRTLTHPPP